MLVWCGVKWKKKEKKEENDWLIWFSLSVLLPNKNMISFFITSSRSYFGAASNFPSLYHLSVSLWGSPFLYFGGGRFSFLKIKGIRACLLFSPAWQPISSTLPTRSQILHTPFQFLPKSLLKSAEFLLDPVLWGWPGRLENISGKYVPNLERPKRATVKAQRRLTLWLSQLSRRNPWCGMTLHSARTWYIFCLVCCSTFGDGEFSGGKCEFKRRWHTHADMCQNISRVPGKKRKKRKENILVLSSTFLKLP